jgi:hypothetical protein
VSPPKSSLKSSAEGERQAAHHGSDNVVPSQIDKAIDRTDTETPGINVFDKSAARGRRLDEEATMQTRAGTRSA